MELRSAENQVQGMLVEYRHLCSETEKWHLPEICSNKEEKEDPATLPSQPRTDVELLSALESLHRRLNDMKPKMDRFRKRLEEVRSCFYMI